MEYIAFDAFTRTIPLPGPVDTEKTTACIQGRCPVGDTAEDSSGEGKLHPGESRVGSWRGSPGPSRS